MDSLPTTIYKNIKRLYANKKLVYGTIAILLVLSIGGIVAGHSFSTKPQTTGLIQTSSYQSGQTPQSTAQATTTPSQKSQNSKPSSKSSNNSVGSSTTPTYFQPTPSYTPPNTTTPTCDWSAAEQRLQDAYNSKEDAASAQYNAMVAQINQTNNNGGYSSSAEYLLALANAQSWLRNQQAAIQAWYNTQTLSEYC